MEGGRRARSYEAPTAAAAREHENAVEPPPTLHAELTPGAAAADIVAACEGATLTLAIVGAALALAIVGALLRAAAEPRALILPKY